MYAVPGTACVYLCFVRVQTTNKYPTYSVLRITVFRSSSNKCCTEQQYEYSVESTARARYRQARTSPLPIILHSTGSNDTRCSYPICQLVRLPCQAVTVRQRLRTFLISGCLLSNSSSFVIHSHANSNPCRVVPYLMNYIPALTEHIRALAENSHSGDTAEQY